MICGVRQLTSASPNGMEAKCPDDAQRAVDRLLWREGTTSTPPHMTVRTLRCGSLPTREAAWQGGAGRNRLDAMVGWKKHR